MKHKEANNGEIRFKHKRNQKNLSIKKTPQRQFETLKTY